jgi:hypothetical protein
LAANNDRDEAASPDAKAVPAVKGLRPFRRLLTHKEQ